MGDQKQGQESETEREGERELEREKLRGKAGDLQRGRENTYKS